MSARKLHMYQTTILIFLMAIAILVIGVNAYYEEHRWDRYL